MSDDEIPLFSIKGDKPNVPTESPITNEQVTSLREAFRDAGMHDPEERAALVRSCVIRPVSSLRDLLPRDMRPILKRIQERSQAQPSRVGSAWDTRDHETWIDKL